jgi:2-phosphoglycerate kinase
MTPPRVILIGGTSHAGKTTLAHEVAARLGWDCVSTDYLKRHPGRPWKAPPETVPARVVEHYRDLDVDELIASVVAHYTSLWPRIEEMIRERVAGSSASGLVIEGSAILPALAGGARGPAVTAVWITAATELMETRIRTGSGYASADPASRALIDKFIARTVRFDALVREDVRRLGLPLVRVDEEPAGGGPIQTLVRSGILTV